MLKINQCETIELSPWFNIQLAVEDAFFYPIMGYYLDNKVDIQSIKSIFCVICLCAGIVLPAIATYIEGVYFGYSENYVQLFDYMTAFGAFLLLKKGVLLFGRKLKILPKIAKLCFGIYLLDPIWRILILDDFDAFRIAHFNWIDLSIGWIFASFLLGGSVTAFIKKIPGARKLL